MKSVFLALMFAALPQEEEAKTSGIAGVAELVQATVKVEGSLPKRFSYGFGQTEGWEVYAFSTEEREGLVALIGGYGRTPDIGEKSGLSVLFFLHFYANRTAFLELQILNDAMDNPPGAVNVDYEVRFRGDVVASGTRRMADETGLGFTGGEPFFAPREDLWEKYLSQMPLAGSVHGISRTDAEKKEDPDEVRNTHQSGSPRNRWASIEASKYAQTGDDRYLARLMDFVMAQARRPYHLSEKNGEPFLFSKYPDARFIEGKPEKRAYLETFGRILLEDSDFDNGGYNGWDHEHMNVEELYAAYVMLGSRIARRELVLIAEELLSTRYVKDEGKHQHSARAFGWNARALIRAWQATGEERYRNAVRRMMDSLRAHWSPAGAYRTLIAQKPRNDHMPDQMWESPFMVAVATSTIALYLREEGEDEEARELLKFCGDLLVERGYSPAGGGFYYDYSAESSDKTGDGTKTRGVVFYIVSPLVDVAEFVPENERQKYLTPAKRMFDLNKNEPWGSPASDVYHRWFLKAAREFNP
ncbi:MAG: hypothetical protein VX252_05975 [Myxococcota bacterium]|nr:hypothetical protein [Myxococcota bacterium]